MSARTIALWPLAEEPTDSHDPRYDYPSLSYAQAYTAWPCAHQLSDGPCRTRLDEHANEAARSAYPALDITDHPFIPMLDEGTGWARIPADDTRTEPTA